MKIGSESCNYWSVSKAWERAGGKAPRSGYLYDGGSAVKPIWLGDCYRGQVVRKGARSQMVM